MLTIHREKGYRFFFSLEGQEPPHVHVSQAEASAKYWLEPARLARSNGFRGTELREIMGLVKTNREVFLESWNEHFRNTL